mgnify:CR=1 FL=1
MCKSYIGEYTPCKQQSYNGYAADLQRCDGDLQHIAFVSWRFMCLIKTQLISIFLMYRTINTHVLAMTINMVRIYFMCCMQVEEMNG